MPEPHPTPDNSIRTSQAGPWDGMCMMRLPLNLKGPYDWPGGSCESADLIYTPESPGAARAPGLRAQGRGGSAIEYQERTPDGCVVP